MMTRAADPANSTTIVGAVPPAAAATLPWFQAPVAIARQTVTGHSYADTLATLGRMAALIQLGSGHPTVRRASAAAAPGFENLGRANRARAVFAWLKQRVRFVQDDDLVAATARLSGLDLAPDAELLIAPWLLLDMQPAVGDCDDFTMAAAAMLRAMGVPVELVIIAADPERPEEFTHVYCYAVLEHGDRLAMDVSHGPHAGWEAPRFYRREVWPVFDLVRGTGLNGVDPAEQRGLYGRNVGLGEVDWGNIIKSGTETGFSILKAQFGNPPVGTYLSTPQGTYYRGTNAAAGANLPFPPDTGSGTGTWVLLGAGALLLVLAMGRR